MKRYLLLLFSILILPGCGGENYYNIAIFHGKQGDYKKAIEINPRFDIAYSNLGNVYRLIFEYDKACENWEKALELGNESCKEKIENNCK